MEFLESIGWIALGFVPTLLSLKLWEITSARRRATPVALSQKMN